MFERFTMNARQVVVLSQQAARELHHPFIGTEHLLLALLDSGCGATHVILREAGVTRERVLADINRMVRPDAVPLGEGDAAALEAIGIDLEAVRAKVEELFGPGALQPTQPEGRRGWLRRKVIGDHRPFSVRAKKVLELSLREAVALRHNFIAPEHILLGILRESGGLAAKILAEEGLNVTVLRRQAIAALTKAA
ncbi:Clp protease N-terminal domain-containing protein [Planosporangium sp. 12N6]|uniref:Clp protease N-terminal domain-containing protein n=1 Tax=Planosporangium spinosum TaxID=3402278 RepID=UPI003CE75AA3